MSPDYRDPSIKPVSFRSLECLELFVRPKRKLSEEQRLPFYVQRPKERAPTLHSTRCLEVRVREITPEQEHLWESRAMMKKEIWTKTEEIGQKRKA